MNKPRICFEFIAASSCFAILPSHADSGKRVEMLYKVAFKSADLLRMSLVTPAAMLAICLLALVETTNTAEAEDSLPENGKIAFASMHLRDLTTTYNWEIYTVNADGSELRKLTNNTSSDLTPAWSPDGTKIAYDSFGPQMTVMDADGSNKRKLTLHSREAIFVSPTWSADGTQLAFSPLQPIQSFTPDIYTVDTDGSDLTNLTKSPEVEESDPDFSPNGLQMCFYGGNYKTGFGIFIRNSDGSNLTPLVSNKPHRRYSDCDWSPDGTKIATTYYPDRHPGDPPNYGDVSVLNADGSGKINLTKSPEVNESYPSWSPDGTKITFSSDRRGGDTEIYTMDADGTEVAQVTNSPKNEISPDWQPLTPQSRSMTVNPPNTGGPSLLWVASALLFSLSCLLYAMVRPRM